MVVTNEFWTIHYEKRKVKRNEGTERKKEGKRRDEGRGER